MTQEVARTHAAAATPTLAQCSSFRDKIDTIKQTVAKGASDAQLEMFLTLADRYQLDPFLKEIWFTPQIGIITGRDGYLKVAQRDPDYDGIVSAAIREGDHFQMNPVIPEVTHQFGAKRGPVIGAYAISFHKKRRPAVCFADLAEYKKQGGVWSTYTSAMICKVAEVMALKRQFGISGLVSEEEIGHASDPQPEVVSRKVEPKQRKPFDLDKMRASITEMESGIGHEAFMRILGNEGFSGVDEILTREDGVRIFGLMKMEAQSQSADAKEDWVPSVGEMQQGQLVDAEVVNAD